MRKPRAGALMDRLESRVLLHAGDGGTGLLAQYFDNVNFTSLKLTRTDATVNFAWGTGSPASSIAADTFSVRWTGQLIPEATEKVTFYTSTDDGVRLWVDGKLIIDKLRNQPLTQYTSAAVSLVSGHAVDIKMDYYDNTGQASAKLSWSSPSTPKQVIPVDHLYPTAAPDDPPDDPPPPPPTSPAIRIDAAGSRSYTDANGNIWQADKYFSGGQLSLGEFPVAGTTDDVFYATRRFGTSFSYAIPLAKGSYTLNLLFADASYGPGGRLFNVSAEGKQILKNFDIVGEAGKGLPMVKSFPVTINDGTLNLSFTKVLNNATLSAIEILPLDVAPAGITWQSVAPSPVVRAEALGAVVNGKLYVLGGYFTDSQNRVLARALCDVYDPATNKWTQLGDEPEVITHSGIAVDDGVIWLVGAYLGDHPGPGSTHVWKYDTTTDSWTRGPDLPEARGAGGAAIVGRQLHFMGGMDETRTIDEGEHWSLDLDNPDAGWISRAPLPNPRNHVAAASLGGKIYAIGGQHDQEAAQVAQSDVHCYDPLTDTWTKMASLPAPRSHAGASTFVMGERIVVLGGEIGYNLNQNTVYAYDPATNAWSLLGLLPAKRSTSVAGVIGVNQIITATGNSPGATAEAWIGTLSP